MNAGTICAIIGASVAVLGLLGKILWNAVQSGKTWVEFTLEVALLKHHEKTKADIHSAMAELPCRSGSPCDIHDNVAELQQTVTLMAKNWGRPLP